MARWAAQGVSAGRMRNAFVIDDNAERRSDVCRTLLDGQGHAEPFETIEEFLAFAPSDGSAEGFALIHDSDGDAVRLCDRLRDDPRLVPVIGYGHRPVLGNVVAAMQAGAASYLAWPFTLAEYSREIERIGDQVLAALDHKRRHARARQLLAGLTTREREVLVSLITYGTNKAIAKALDISPRTVEKYRAAILVRLGVTNSAQAIRVAVEGGAFEAAMDAGLAQDDAQDLPSDPDVIG